MTFSHQYQLDFSMPCGRCVWDSQQYSLSSSSNEQTKAMAIACIIVGRESLGHLCSTTLRKGIPYLELAFLFGSLWYLGYDCLLAPTPSFTLPLLSAVKFLVILFPFLYPVFYSPSIKIPLFSFSYEKGGREKSKFYDGWYSPDALKKRKDFILRVKVVHTESVPD